MKKTIVFIITFQLLSCKGQSTDGCMKQNAYDKVTQIPEIKPAINTYKNSNQKIVFEIDEGIYNKKNIIS